METTEKELSDLLKKYRNADHLNNAEWSCLRELVKAARTAETKAAELRIERLEELLREALIEIKHDNYEDAGCLRCQINDALKKD